MGVSTLSKNTVFSCAISTMLLFSYGGQAFADPSVSGVSLVDSDKVKQGSTLLITGRNFGSKETAAPVLFDRVDHAFEYGKLNRAHSTLSDGGEIPGGRKGDEGAVWASKTEGFLFSTESDHRHTYANASYYLIGENAWVGGPVAYGGETGWDTPTDNPQLYVSWWYKNKYNSTYYWRFSPNQQTGEFVPGEDLVIEDQEKGRDYGVYVGIDKEGTHNAVLYGHRNKNNLIGARIRGAKSGASTVFPDQFRGGDGYGYETPGSKLARIWDDPEGAAGIRSSVALHNAYVSPSRDGYSRATIYYNLGVPADEWVHIEYELDTDKGLLRMYEDGKLLGEDYFPPEAIYSGDYSPTLSLLGTNAKQLLLQESWISDIYVDSSLQRVVIGNARRYEDVTHKELQRPTVWANDEIEVAVNLGSLGFEQDLYVFVIDKNGVANSSGVPLCTGEACPAPPASVQLLVE